MTTTITHRCGHSTTYWASDRGGYVYITSPGHPGSLGQQPTRRGGSTLSCGPSIESLRQVARAHQRDRRRGNPIPCEDCEMAAIGAGALL